LESTNTTYIAIDLKSFYASVECIERDLDPMTAKLVVADESRTDKTICLAVSPTLKKWGVSGRPRLFEVKQLVREDFIIAVPRMALYVEYSKRIYDVYMKYIAPEDIHVYSIDEVFMDITAYLKLYRQTPHELAKTITKDVLDTTGITASVGIGTNMYLCKVAMDIVAKKMPEDEDGFRIAALDEMTYRRLLWNHRPIRDFWRVGRGYSKRLEEVGLYTMGDIARCSLGKEGDYYNEDLLYKMFGINAELLIDHAWGVEPCRMSDVKEYKPASNSTCSGQVLHRPYAYEETRTVVQEMADALSLDLVDRGLVTNQIVLTVGYDSESLEDPKIKSQYSGAISTDQYGKKRPKHAHGTVNLKKHTSSTKLIVEGVTELFEDIVNENLLARRVSIAANNIVPESEIIESDTFEQLDLFTDYQALQSKEDEVTDMEKEKRQQEAILAIRKKYGKNAVLKGLNFKEGSTGRDRNKQIGGHRA
jgi:DNA polymerase V